MDGYDIARRLERFAHDGGFVALVACYIVGEFNLADAEGSVYSDEGHLWCRGCADRLLERAHALLPEQARKDHFVCATDADGEDTLPHCMACGETLEGSVSSYCVEEELAHYADHPLGDSINERQAVEIAQVLYSAPTNREAKKLGKKALAAIRSTKRMRLAAASPLGPS